MGGYTFLGERWTDQMCLKQQRDNRTLASGSYCVKNQEFLLASSVIGGFNANGVIGLAPTGSSLSYIENMKKQGQLQSMVVGINYENPIDTNQKSVITFGQINFDEIDGGEDGLSYHSNLAVGKWGVLMDYLSYGQVDLTVNHYAKIALIDSGNFSIQIPSTMHSKLRDEMKK